MTLEQLLTGEEPVQHRLACSSAFVMRPGTHVLRILNSGTGTRSASAIAWMAFTVSAVPRMTVESSFTGMTTMPDSAAAR